MHGVNLDTLGRRDPEIYGTFTLTELETQVKRWARELDLEATFFQTNHEGEFCEYLHRLPERADAVMINAGAWTHYSWAIRDALEVAGMPAVEVHISDVPIARGLARVSVFDGPRRSRRSPARAWTATGEALEMLHAGARRLSRRAGREARRARRATRSSTRSSSATSSAPATPAATRWPTCAG